MLQVSDRLLVKSWESLEVPERPQHFIEEQERR